MATKGYFRGMVTGIVAGAALATSISAGKSAFYDPAITFREATNEGSKGELYLQTKSPQRTYLLKEDAQGNIIGISEYQNLEFKLGKTTCINK